MEARQDLEPNVQEVVAELDAWPKFKKVDSFLSIPLATNKVLPSVVQAPKLELKALPQHLKYAYLGEGDTLPVIVSSTLSKQQEERLLDVLKRHKTAIGWTLADIKGISPTLCVHRILLEDGAKPTKEGQRRLNPPMMKVVKDEVIKLRDCGVIFPISDIKWISSV